MTSPEVVNLAGIGQLHREAPRSGEAESLIRSAEARLNDAAKAGLTLDSRFDLAYNAAHALALAALRRRGYRPANRYVVFQALPHTLGIGAALVRTLAKAHEIRNLGEYEGESDLTEGLVTDLVKAARELSRRLAQPQR